MTPRVGSWNSRSFRRHLCSTSRRRAWVKLRAKCPRRNGWRRKSGCSAAIGPTSIGYSMACGFLASTFPMCTWETSVSENNVCVRRMGTLARPTRVANTVGPECPTSATAALRLLRVSDAPYSETDSDHEREAHDGRLVRQIEVEPKRVWHQHNDGQRTPCRKKVQESRNQPHFG